METKILEEATMIPMALQLQPSLPSKLSTIYSTI